MAAIFTKVALGALQGIIWRIAQVETQWGVFDSSGKALGEPSLFSGLTDSVLEAVGLGSTLSTQGVEYVKEIPISDYPIEKGSFASYNKVETPATPSVRMALQGFETTRKAFLAAIDAACKSTNLYSVVTPEVTYKDYSIERYEYSRKASAGATLLLLTLYLREIRQVSAQYSTTKVQDPKQASATPAADGGKVQPQTPGTSTLKTATDKLGAIF